jgi:hypothetical protein
MRRVCDRGLWRGRYQAKHTNTHAYAYIRTRDSISRREGTPRRVPGERVESMKSMLEMVFVFGFAIRTGGFHSLQQTRITHPLLELSHKILMELDQAVRPLCAGRQERRSEMQRAFLLTKARASNDTHARSVEHAEAVELVWFAAFFLRLLNGFGREVDGGEKVHGALGT